MDLPKLRLKYLVGFIVKLKGYEFTEQYKGLP